MPVYAVGEFANGVAVGRTASSDVIAVNRAPGDTFDVLVDGVSAAGAEARLREGPWSDRGNS